MTLATVPDHFFGTLISDLDGEFARKVKDACFVGGMEDEFRIDFFRLWGRVVRCFYNRRDTTTQLHYVEGEDLEIFNYYYPDLAA